MKNFQSLSKVSGLVSSGAGPGMQGCSPSRAVFFTPLLSHLPGAFHTPQTLWCLVTALSYSDFMIGHESHFPDMETGLERLAGSLKSPSLWMRR